MIAFLLALGLVVLLVVGGLMISLRLRIPSMPTQPHMSGLRRSYAAPMDYTTAENTGESGDEMSNYARRVFAILILIIFMASLFIINAISSVH
jgi:hypothetical protein